MEEYSSGSIGEKNSGNFNLPGATGNQGGNNLPKKSCLFGMGCVGCGILGCLGVIVLLIATIAVTLAWFKNNILSSTPLEMPEVIISAAEKENLEERLTKLKEDLKNKPREIISLDLTASELNYIFQDNSKKSQDNVNIYLTIDSNDRITFMLSIPWDKKKSNYINISGKCTIEVEDGKFSTDFEQLNVGRFRFNKDAYLRRWSEAFAEEIPGRLEEQKFPYKIKKLKIKNGIMHLELISGHETTASATPEIAVTPQTDVPTRTNKTQSDDVLHDIE